MNEAERRLAQAAYLLRNMLAAGVIDVPQVLGILEGRPQLLLVEEGKAA
ncbi:MULTISPECIES: hypothetical protein [Arthrobacter]|uniref:Uncharacterized protein n=1 Tax=Arthrobacter methylotrophus TaxID=121291 RepID=A0ABV5UVW3_9MICC|nr:hypothetical protein [Arthrobacter sp. MA-N2]